MSDANDATKRAPDRALVPEGYRKPSHGKGMLRNFQPGNAGRPSNVATRFGETQRFAREHSLEAVKTLVERLRDPDGRIAVVAANSILERAWGKVREQKPEEQRQASIDLSKLSSAELALLLKLAESGRLVDAPDEPSDAPQIEGKVDDR